VHGGMGTFGGTWSNSLSGNNIRITTIHSEKKVMD